MRRVVNWFPLYILFFKFNTRIYYYIYIIEIYFFLIYYKHVLLFCQCFGQTATLFYYYFREVQLENSMFTYEICKHWDEIHWYECRWINGLSKEITLHSKLKLRNCFESRFVPPTLKEELPKTKPMKGGTTMFKSLNNLR